MKEYPPLKLNIPADKRTGRPSLVSPDVAKAIIESDEKIEVLAERYNVSTRHIGRLKRKARK